MVEALQAMSKTMYTRQLSECGLLCLQLELT